MNETQHFNPARPQENLAIIVAYDRNRLIGKEMHLPWKIPEDLAYFRSKTLGHKILMGKRTYFSLGKPLDQRTNLILSSDEDLFVPGCIMCRSIPEALEHIGDDTCFIIGGAAIFRQFLPLVGKLHITRIEYEFEGDTWFPEYDPGEWNCLYFEQMTTKDGYHISFNEYIRVAR